MYINYKQEMLAWDCKQFYSSNMCTTFHNFTVTTDFNKLKGNERGEHKVWNQRKERQTRLYSQIYICVYVQYVLGFCIKHGRMRLFTHLSSWYKCTFVEQGQGFYKLSLALYKCQNGWNVNFTKRYEHIYITNVNEPSYKR